MNSLFAAALGGYHASTWYAMTTGNKIRVPFRIASQPWASDAETHDTRWQRAINETRFRFSLRLWASDAEAHDIR